jgi:hypothetical protein
MKSSRPLVIAAFCILILTFPFLGFAQKGDKDARPMPFEESKATQHFYLLKNGGAVELAAKDPADKPTIDAIQKHLQSQAKNFEKGVFEVPTAEKGKVPESVNTMKKLRREITFEVMQMDAGAALRMFSVNTQARQAIQDFLKLQIEEHHTGDPMEVQ